MIDLALGTIQRSIVEIDLIDGERCEDEPSFDVDAVSARYAATGRLLLVPGLAEVLSRIAEGYDTFGRQRGEPRLYRAAMALWEKVRSV